MPNVKAVFKTYGRYLNECNLKEHFIHIKLGNKLESDHLPTPNWARKSCVICEKPIKHEIPIYE